MKPPAPPRFVLSLAALLAAMVALSAWHPKYPHDWLLENVMVLVAVTYVGATYRWMPLSRASYVLILVFLGLHEIGAHWTFAEVPYDDAFRRLTGTGLNELLGWERNHYDRFVHLAYGLFITLPMRETLEAKLRLQGITSAFVTWIFMFATSSAYEQIEWAAALVFGGDLGIAYLGTQGDVWDAHKDTGLAVLGTTLILALQAARSSRET